MKFRFFFGPDRAQFVPFEDGTIASESTIPFHGIVSRGLITRMIKSKIGNGVWCENALKLGLPITASELKDLDFSILTKLANDCRVLSFSQSALCVKVYVRDYCDDLSAKNQEFCDIWNIKEGHTSSVWLVNIQESKTSKKFQFIINVARDYEAGIELESTSKKMKHIAKRCPDINIAKVLDVQRVLINYNGIPSKVVVTKNEWVENSYEIISVKDGSSEREQYLLVDRFLTKEDQPSQINSIYGRKFSNDESIKIKKDIQSFLKKASFAAADININHGDAVWNGEGAIIVAVS